MIQTIIQKFPAPIFALLGIYSLFYGNDMCGSVGSLSSMTIMWFLMALAHISPYLKSNCGPSCSCSKPN